MKILDNTYKVLLDSIGETLQQARTNAFKAINAELVKANWLMEKVSVKVIYIFVGNFILNIQFSRQCLEN